MHRPKLSIKLWRRPSNHDSRPSTTPQAVAYLRSRHAASAGLGHSGTPSLEEQQEAINRAAAKLGAVVVEEFIDINASAGNMNRPALKHMLQFVKRQPITYCIVHRLDRLTRHLPDAMSIYMALIRSETVLIQAANLQDSPGNHEPLDATRATPRTPNREE